MDLYLFYNCFNNLKEIYETPDNKLTLRHQYLFNNPLLLSEYFDRTKYKPIYLDSFSGGGTGAVKLAAGAAAGKGKDAAAATTKGKGKGTDAAAAKGKGAGKENNKSENDKSENDTSENDVQSELDSGADEDELAGIKKTIKAFMKIIIGIILVICIPIVPWILISFYAFKNLGEFLEINMNRL
jgi:hypothetical protein